MTLNLVWLRNDLRIDDNPALYQASKNGPVCCVYIATPLQWEEHCDAPAKIDLWRQRLINLSDELNEKNIPLKFLSVARYSDSIEALHTLVKSLNITHLFFNKEYPLNEKNRDRAVTELMHANAVHTHQYDADVVMAPGTVLTQQNAVYKVFTPFSRQWHKQANENCLITSPKPRKQKPLNIERDDIAKLWDKKTCYRDDLWPTETKKISQRLQKFCINTASSYKEKRDIPSINGTSTLSPYLAIGALSVRQCITEIREHIPDWRSNQWVTELIWREFYRHLIDHYPHLSKSNNFIQTAKAIPWENNDMLFSSWCKGETGFPIVDAAMKQLIQTGWMHNRLRMIVAAFLTKLLFIDWRKGEAFFMTHLLDGDYASNNGGWQWAASTGADAAPYFRIFNPERQSERFDPEGLFIKKLLPELDTLDKKSIHNPSSAQRKACAYPEPIIDYKWARQRALDEYANAMGKSK